MMTRKHDFTVATDGRSNINHHTIKFSNTIVEDRLYPHSLLAIFSRIFFFSCSAWSDKHNSMLQDIRVVLLLLSSMFILFVVLHSAISPHSDHGSDRAGRIAKKDSEIAEQTRRGKSWVLLFGED